MLGRILLTLLVVAILCCSPEEEHQIHVDILEVLPLEIEREGGSATLAWRVRGADRVYYSLTVGLERRLVASGRAEGGLRHEVELLADDLDPCTNQVVLTAVEPGGAADEATEVVFLCPTPGCRGCSSAPDGDTDVDVDSDTDVDIDSDSDADDCQAGAFPNGGSCDPVTSRCCEPGQSCEPDPRQGFREACQDATGNGDLGDGCSSSLPCAPGLTCFDYICTHFCSDEGWDYDCPEGYRCFTFRVSVDGGPYYTCPSYGICLPY